MATSGEAFGISIAIYACVLLAVFLAFSILRRIRLTRRFYAPKRYARHPDPGRPPPLATKIGAWVPGTVRLTEDQVVTCAGVDALTYLKLLRMGVELFLMVSVLSLVIILPINATGGNLDNLIGQNDPNSETEYTFTDLDKLTMANIPTKSDRLYAHSILTWAVSFVAMWQFWRYCRTVLRLRIYHLLHAPPGAETHTVLVTDVPGIPRGTVLDRLTGPWLKFVPKSVKDKAFQRVAALKKSYSQIGLQRHHPGIDIDDNTGGGHGATVEQVSAAVTAEHLPPGGLASTPYYGAEHATTAEQGGTGAHSASPMRAAAAPEPQDDEPLLPLSRFHMPDQWDEAIATLNEGNNVEEMIDEKFKGVYGDEVVHVHSTYATSTLDSLVASYDKLKGQAIDAVDQIVTKHRRGKTIKPRRKLVVGQSMGAWGKEKYGNKPHKVNAYEFMKERLEYLREAITNAQLDAHKHVYPSAFVTFGTRRSQMVAAGALMAEDLTTWRCHPAPRPDELIWSNLGMRSWERNARSFAMLVAFVALTAFYLIPVAALQALLSTNSLVSWIEDIPIVDAAITAILPGLALTIFLAILPPLLRLMLRYAGRISDSTIDSGVISRFYVFQVVTVFFGSFLAGSMANQAKQLFDDPSSFIDILGTAAPQTAIFFATFLLVRGMLNAPITFLRLVGLVIYWIRTGLASTARAKDRLISNAPYLYGTVIPGDTIAVLLGLTFSLIFPIITPVAVVYFCTAYLFRKHDLCYVNTTAYQSGGAYWPQVFNQLVTGLIIFQIIMIALLGIKETIAPPLIVLPLPFLTLLYARAAHSTFFPPMRTLSLLSAARRDAQDKAGPEAVKEKKEAYVSPSFRIDDNEHREIISQLALLAQAQEAEDYSAVPTLVSPEDDIDAADDIESFASKHSPSDVEAPAQPAGGPLAVGGSGQAVVTGNEGAALMHNSAQPATVVPSDASAVTVPSSTAAAVSSST